MQLNRCQCCCWQIHLDVLEKREKEKRKCDVDVVKRRRERRKKRRRNKRERKEQVLMMVVLKMKVEVGSVERVNRVHLVTHHTADVPVECTLFCTANLLFLYIF